LEIIDTKTGKKIQFIDRKTGKPYKGMVMFDYNGNPVKVIYWLKSMISLAIMPLGLIIMMLPLYIADMPSSTAIAGKSNLAWALYGFVAALFFLNYYHTIKAQSSPSKDAYFDTKEIE